MYYCDDCGKLNGFYKTHIHKVITHKKYRTKINTSTKYWFHYSTHPSKQILPLTSTSVFGITAR